MLKTLTAAALVGGLSLAAVPAMSIVAHAQDAAAPAPPTAPTPDEAKTGGGMAKGGAMKKGAMKSGAMKGGAMKGKMHGSMKKKM